MLVARDNVPLISWLALGGKCRDCRISIPARYPLVEGLTAAGFAGAVMARGVSLDLIWELPFVAMLVTTAAIDLERRIVPNRILIPATAVALACLVAFRLDHAVELLAAGAGAFAFLLAAALLKPGGMGMGDVKLGGVIGLYLGLSVIPALLIAFLAGTVVGLVIMARQGAGARKRAVPFAPFLALGAYLGLLVGPELIDLYSSRFLS